MMQQKIVLVTGGFDPLHSGHLEYLKCSKTLGNILIVGLNSDKWLSRKKGKSFLPYYEREQILLNLKGVDNVINFNDDDDSAVEAILKVKHFYPNSFIIFANGGDRTKKNIPEVERFMDNENIRFEFSVGGLKQNSSSTILEKWNENKTEKTWGHYSVLDEGKGYKVKTLYLLPHQHISLQAHKYRSEYWIVVKGKADLLFPHRQTLTLHDSIVIDKEEIHQVANNYDEPCVIVEVQYGEEVKEEDITRYVIDYGD